MTAAALPPAALGFLLGWSIAWPPGPVNAEMIRRGVARGFRAAFALGLGATTGDALWAILVGVGAGTLIAQPVAATLLQAISGGLLAALALGFGRGAWRSLAAWRAGAWQPRRARFNSTRGGYLLGIAITLSSPWNIAFWLAVIGQGNLAVSGATGVVVLATAVLLGALAWCLTLCGAVALLKRRLETPLWDIASQAATALVMAWFAIRALGRLASA